jgi:hypothetical protein
MNDSPHIAPIPGFKALNGYNCLSSSFKRICAFHGYAISEPMLLGLGSGVGFGYWQQQGSLPFLGGRGNVKAFHTDLAARTGIQIIEHTTGSPQKAEKALLQSLDGGEPVVIYADMAYLPHLGLGPDAHFGEHAIVIAGYDAATQQVLISDIVPHMTGLKDGGFHGISLEQLRRARSSPYRPFPPKNRWFTFDFSTARQPDATGIYQAISFAVDAMLNPPLRVLGVKGISTAAQRVSQWPMQFDEAQVRGALFNFYVYTEIGGTGGGLFRYMYSDFLAEAAALTGNTQLAEASERVHQCADAWRALAQPLEAAWEVDNPTAMLPGLSAALNQVSDLEAEAWEGLKAALPQA